MCPNTFLLCRNPSHWYYYHPYQYNVNWDEIEETVEVPLEIFLKKKFTKTENFTHKGKTVKVYYYNYDKYLIWGLTARILTDFCSRIINLPQIISLFWKNEKCV